MNFTTPVFTRQKSMNITYDLHHSSIYQAEKHEHYYSSIYQAEKHEHYL